MPVADLSGNGVVPNVGGGVPVTVSDRAFPETATAVTVDTELYPQKKLGGANSGRTFIVKVSGGDTMTLSVSMDGVNYVAVTGGAFTSDSDDILDGNWRYMRWAKTGTAAVASVLMQF